jgi:hypothetical protein
MDDDGDQAAARGPGAAAGQPAPGPTARRDGGADAGAPAAVAPASAGAAGAPGPTAPAPPGAAAPGGPQSLDELARKVGLPAEHPGLPGDDAQVVQRAFGEHAATVREYLARGRGGSR